MDRHVGAVSCHCAPVLIFLLFYFHSDKQRLWEIQTCLLSLGLNSDRPSKVFLIIILDVELQGLAGVISQL